jgi:hypothetical protein
LTRSGLFVALAAGFGVFAGPQSAAAKVVLSMEKGIDRPGSDYRSFDLRVPPPRAPAACRDACRRDARCKAYTYVRPGIQGKLPRCWLKSSVPAKRASDCCISGVKAAGTSKPVGKPAGKPAGKPTGKPTGIPAGCKPKLKVTRYGAVTRAGGVASAITAWGAAARAKYGLGYRWTRAREKTSRCSRDGLTFNCYAEGYPCK